MAEQNHKIVWQKFRISRTLLHFSPRNTQVLLRRRNIVLHAKFGVFARFWRVDFYCGKKKRVERLAPFKRIWHSHGENIPSKITLPYGFILPSLRDKEKVILHISRQPDDLSAKPTGWAPIAGGEAALRHHTRLRLQSGANAHWREHLSQSAP